MRSFSRPSHGPHSWGAGCSGARCLRQQQPRNINAIVSAREPNKAHCGCGTGAECTMCHGLLVACVCVGVGSLVSVRYCMFPVTHLTGLFTLSV